MNTVFTLTVLASALWCCTPPSGKDGATDTVRAPGSGEGRPQKTTQQPVGKGTRFALRVGGLPLCEAPGSGASVLDTLPLGTRVELLGSASVGVSFESDGLTGSHVRVSAGGGEGYVFSGYLGPYPVPSFAVREYYEKGDFGGYVSELRSLGISATHHSKENVERIIFPDSRLQEVFLIAQLLLPELLLYDHAGQLIKMRREDLDQEQTFSVEPMNRPHWNWANVYETTQFDSTGTDLMYYYLYYPGDGGQADISLIREDGHVELKFVEGVAPYLKDR